MRNVADLRGQVRCHGIDGIGEVFPRAGDAWHHGLTAKTSVGADLARNARHFGSECAQLIHHRVDGVLQQQDLAADIDRDLLGQVAIGNRNCHFGDIANLIGQIARHLIDGLGELSPYAGDAFDLGLSTELALRSHFPRHARDLGREDGELLDHCVHELRRAQKLALESTAINLQLH